MRKIYLKKEVTVIIQADNDVTMEQIQEDLNVSVVIPDDSALFGMADIADSDSTPWEVTDSK
jgi:hypothetical protein